MTLKNERIKSALKALPKYKLKNEPICETTGQNKQKSYLDKRGDDPSVISAAHARKIMRCLACYTEENFDKHRV